MRAPKILDQLPIEEISHLKAAANYTVLFDRENRKHVSSYSLKVFAELFKDLPFVRLDRSTLVRESFIRSINKSNTVLLRNNQTINLPRRRLKTLSQELNLNI